MGNHFQRGQLLFELKRYREAVEAFQTELAEDPNSAITHAMMGAAFINMRRVRDADQAVRRAIELAPEMAYAFYVHSFVEQHRNRLANAEQAIAESIRLQQDPDAFFQWAVIAEQRGRSNEAMTAVTRAMELNPKHAKSVILRGKLLARIGRLEEAHALYAIALAHNPENAAAHHAIGSLQLRTGDAKSALGMLREARRLDPMSANDAKAIAVAYGRMVFPLRVIDRFTIRWYQWSPKRRWFLFVALAATFAVGSEFFGLSGSKRNAGVSAWATCWMVVANYGLLPFTLDRVAWATGAVLLRREFGVSWHRLLRMPLIVVDALYFHGLATMGAIFVSVEPMFGLIACQFGACFPLLAGSMRSEASRQTGYTHVALLCMLIGLCGVGGVLLTLDEPIVGMALWIAFFGVTYFSDNIADCVSSWRLRRSPLMKTPPR
jgi:Flp pilus assembly protein TadD